MAHHFTQHWVNMAHHFTQTLSEYCTSFHIDTEWTWHIISHRHRVGMAHHFTRSLNMAHKFTQHWVNIAHNFTQHWVNMAHHFTQTRSEYGTSFHTDTWWIWHIISHRQSVIMAHHFTGPCMLLPQCNAKKTQCDLTKMNNVETSCLLAKSVQTRITRMCQNLAAAGTQKWCKI